MLPIVMLNRCIGLLFPSQDHAGQALPAALHATALATARQAFLSIFHGLTDDGTVRVFEKHGLHGVYTTSSGQSISESIVLLYAYCSTADYDGCRDRVEQLARILKSTLSQEAVAVLDFGDARMWFV